jgi:membrane protein required for colicin V production
MNGLHWIDLTMLVVLAISTAVGVWRGFIREVLALAGWVVAYVVAQAMAFEVAGWITPLSGLSAGLRVAVGFVLVFVVVLFAWALGAALVGRLLKATPLRGVDRTLGAAFGVVRAVLLGLAVATAVLMTPLAEHPEWRSATSAQVATRLLAGLRPLLPATIARHLPVPA